MSPGRRPPGVQPPFFTPGADPAVNDCTIGAVIGRELTRRFDSNGRLFDAVGNARDWWTPAANTEFGKRTELLGDQYNGFGVLPGVTQSATRSGLFERIWPAAQRGCLSQRLRHQARRPDVAAAFAAGTPLVTAQVTPTMPRSEKIASMTTEPQTPIHLHIDFVSDVACPWCAVGLWALERALKQLQGQLVATIHPQPFELNPCMGLEGEDITEHLARKYGSTPGQQAHMRETIRQRGAQEGFVFKAEGRGRIWNTFDAHRLLHWASIEGAPGDALALKKALLTAYQGRAENPSDPAVLIAVVQALGSAALPADRARAILASTEMAVEVRERQSQFHGLGISSVPAVIVNHQHLISGGQPAEVFVQAFRQIASGG